MERKIREVCQFAVKVWGCIAILVLIGTPASLAQQTKTALGSPGLPSKEYLEYLKIKKSVNELINRQPCVNAAKKKKILDEAKAEIVFLLKYAGIPESTKESSKLNTSEAKQEAADYADILNSKYVELEKKKVCTPECWTVNDQQLEKSLEGSVSDFQRDYDAKNKEREKLVEETTKLYEVRLIRLPRPDHQSCFRR